MTTALPGVLNISAYRGDTKEWTLAFADAAGVPVDISSGTWAAQIRATLDEPTEILATFDVDTTDAVTGTLVLTLPATEAANLVTGDAAGFPAGKATYYWDLQRTDGAVVKTWLTGKVKVSGDVTVSA